MTMIHRYLGKWLDQNWSSNPDEVLSNAKHPFLSSISGMLQDEKIYNDFEKCVRSGRYSYAVPYEVKSSEITPDKYYRFEVTSEEVSGMKSLGVFYGKGSVVSDMVLFNFIPKGTTFCEYSTYDSMIEDLIEDVKLFSGDRFKLLSILPSIFNVKSVVFENGVAYLEDSSYDGMRTPISENSFRF